MPLKRGDEFPEPGPQKNGLARISVSCPLVEDQHTEEFIPILEAVKKGIRHKVVNGDPLWISRVSGAKVPTRFNRATLISERDGYVRVVSKKFGRQAHHCAFGSCNLKVLQKRIRDPFVEKHTAVLGII